MTVKDFTAELVDPHEFTIDGDSFYLVGELPAGASRKIAEIASEKDNVKRIMLMGDFLDALILEPGRTRFAERMNDPNNPITNKQLASIIEWSLELFGGRPTVPSSNSANGPTAIGTGSTDGVQPGE